MPNDLVTVSETPGRADGATGRGLLAGGAVALAGLLASLALVYTNATGVTDAAARALIQQAAESTLGTTAAARNAIGQALILNTQGFDASVGRAATEEAALVLDTLEQRVDDLATLIPNDAEMIGSASSALALGREVLDRLVAADLDAAGSLALGETTDAFEALTGRLVVVRDGAAQALADAAGQAGTVATASRFMVAFFVPAVAVAITVAAIRRRRRREQLATELTRERELSKSKDQLIANLSHELRTPLTGIYTSALAIEELGTDDPQTALELNGMIVDQSADLNRMVEDLLASAQADAGRLIFDLAPCSALPEVEAVAKEMSRLGPPIVAHAGDATVLADAGRLRQLLRNLVSNAIRHGGPNVLLLADPIGDSYVIRVEDDGPGIPDEIGQRLFERFVHQGDRPLIVGSVGLGLAISKVLAEGMNGSIEYHRADGRTAFEVRLPLAPEPTEAAQPVETPAQPTETPAQPTRTPPNRPKPARKPKPSETPAEPTGAAAALAADASVASTTVS
jgi:signal transduction histidine kinase